MSSLIYPMRKYVKMVIFHGFFLMFLMYMFTTGYPTGLNDLGATRNVKVQKTRSVSTKLPLTSGPSSDIFPKKDIYCILHVGRQLGERLLWLWPLHQRLGPSLPGADINKHSELENHHSCIAMYSYV